MTEIHPIALGTVRVFLLKGERNILVDAGNPGDDGKMVRKLSALGFRPEDISLIIITHGHQDHFGSADRMREITGAPVMMHANDAFSIAEGKNQSAAPRTLAAKIYMRLIKGRLSKFTPFEPDIVIDKEISLHEYGVEGKIIHTPGHTSGSISIHLDDGTCIVGDMLMGRRPAYPMFVSDIGTLRHSIRRILSLNPRLIYASHGGPYIPADVEKLLLR